MGVRKGQQIRYRGLRRKQNVLEVDMTSLLDVLVIILVFLLKSYDSSGLTITINEGIKLPQSSSVSVSSYGVNIQVSQKEIMVDDEEIVSNSRNKNLFDHGGKRIIPLYNILVKKRKEVEAISKLTKLGKKFSGIVNFILDRSLKYGYMKQLLYTVADAGYLEYKFVVLNESAAQ